MSGHVNDEKLAFLLISNAVASGHITDEQYVYYNTVSANTAIQDLQHAFYVAAGVTPGQISDMAYDWLVLQGITPGHISDMWHEYFSFTPIDMDTALVNLDDTSHVFSTPNVIGWTNNGTGGAAYDLIDFGVLGVLSEGTINGLSTVLHSGAGNTRLRSNAETIITDPYTMYVVMKKDVLASQTRTVYLDGYPGALDVNRATFDETVASNFWKIGYQLLSGGFPITGYDRDTLIHVWVLQVSASGAGNGRFNIDGGLDHTFTSGSGFSYINMFSNSGNGEIVDSATNMCQVVIFDALHDADTEARAIQTLKNRWGF